MLRQLLSKSDYGGFLENNIPIFSLAMVSSLPCTDSITMHEHTEPGLEVDAAFAMSRRRFCLCILQTSGGSARRGDSD